LFLFAGPIADVEGCDHAMRPLIGVTTYLTPAKWGVWDAQTALVPATYVDALERAGGRPMLVPPSEDGIEETLDALHGLLLPGGTDIEPELYGQETHPETYGVVPERDRSEVALLSAALERDMPVLAICRGSQILNVARGGDLVQHLPEVVGHDRHKEHPGEFGDHDVRIDAGSRLGGLLGEHAPIKSHHHQGFGRLGEGLRDVAWAEDGTVEAVEDPDRGFLFGVLWHPEAGEDDALFASLVDAARAYRERVKP
jgi:putative glutamine amidotransferase